MNTLPEQLSIPDIRAIAAADDLHIAPLREDGLTVCTPTWIWSVLVHDGLYVRAYHGPKSRWYQAAIRQKAGIIQAIGLTKEVAFEPTTGSINEAIDEAYRNKYGNSPYLSAMINAQARSATIRILPRQIAV